MGAFPAVFNYGKKNGNTTVEHRDVVIVGAGSAGSVLANRLSADHTQQVLVLEAGRMDSLWDLYIHMPSAFSFPIGNKYYDWKYESEPEPEMNGRRIYHARGKVVGGSSSINGQIYQRGNPMDYDKWGDTKGLENWGWNHVLPYFKRMENALGSDKDDPRRGHDGPLRMKRGPADSPLFKAFFKSVQQAGYNYTPDVNGYRQEGFGPFDANIDKGRRLSAARAYLHPALQRPNLELRTRAEATRILFEGTKAVGIEYTWKGRTHQVRADKVILCGGAFNSPQLLEVSGVGDEKILNAAGVNVVKHLPGVGENLQDHLEVYIQYNATQPVSSQPYLEKWRWPFIGLWWMLTHKGPVATSHFEGGGFARSNDNEPYPNLMFHFLPLAMRYDGTKIDSPHGFQFHVGPMYSDARGHVHITSSDIKVKPSILFNYLSTDQDRREWVEAVKVSRKLLDTPAMKEYTDGEISPGADVQTDEEILEWVRKDAETALHPSCTCKMGPASDEMAVVDPETMQVHGTDGLYVVDASVMPGITNGNIYAPTMMIAEKAADLIAGKTPLAPQDIPFYRAGQGMPLDPPESTK
ncbi:choline dehydrogenase [Corynebacterium sp. MSK151]|uniref:choline dehydrogenase n=1 Tax=unclassified Corynebacterium TaxID=2624378 RepID=UPI00254C701D|nr:MULTISPECIES: choline dehydrogenase [unclassified Corynebacterium]MDK8758129.1 choline dehydrogenase [Corynebacterium sp. MSK151]MDK8847004.1 choline dehydrogenase [Corynebacterium sp. MSK047]